MIVRTASTVLSLIPAIPPLLERATAVVDRAGAALDWQGDVRLDAERAAGLSAPRWQQHVRTGLLERALSIGADHRVGPHRGRPEAARRLLAHLDALGEAGLSFAGLQAFSAEAELDNPGALWTLTLLFGCLDLPDADEAFEAWIGTLDEALFLGYRGVVEIADALMIQPSARIRAAAARWLVQPSPALAAIALETMSPEQLAEDALLGLVRRGHPIVDAAIDRLLTRLPEGAPRPRLRRAAWIDIPVPALAYEIARTRLLAGDLEPLQRLRERDARSLVALGPHAIDVLALAGSGEDHALAHELALGLATTPALLDAMGRTGLASLFPRLLASLEDDDAEDSAHAALATALGPGPARPSRAGWEQALSALPRSSENTRLRGGKPHDLASVLEEMRRPELSAQDLRSRADEVFSKAAKQIPLAWDALGVSLEGAISELARLAR